MKKFESKTSQLTLAAILLAVFVILHVIVPGGNKVIQGVLMIVTFLPLTVYSVCCGTQKTLIMAAAGAVICALLLPPVVTLSYAVPALLVGVVGGMCYGKCKRLTVILILSTMQLLQNVVELGVYSWLMNINLMDTYTWGVSLVYEKIPSEWFANPVFKAFFEDLTLCAIPSLAVVAAGAKGILSFQLLRLLHSRLTAVMGPEVDATLTQQTKFRGKGISLAYFCVIVLCTVTAALPFLSVIPYHIVSAAAASLGLLSAILYVYYFYSIRVRTLEDHSKRILYSFAIVALLPLSIFALPLLEIRLLGQEAQTET